MESKHEDLNQSQYLTFYLAGEEYAITILRIKEIIEYDVVTKVPRMPAWIRGVINLRGNVVPVVDLAVKFGSSASQTTKLSCVIIVELELDNQPMVMGILADSVNQVVELAAADVQAPPAFGTRVKADYLVGMGKLGKKFALILDIDRVLSTDDLLASTATVPEAAEIATTAAAAAVVSEIAPQ